MCELSSAVCRAFPHPAHCCTGSRLRGHGRNSSQLTLGKNECQQYFSIYQIKYIIQCSSLMCEDYFNLILYEGIFQGKTPAVDTALAPWKAGGGVQELRRRRRQLPPCSGLLAAQVQTSRCSPLLQPRLACGSASFLLPPCS